MQTSALKAVSARCRKVEKLDVNVGGIYTYRWPLRSVPSFHSLCAYNTKGSAHILWQHLSRYK
jgi:hypothetical protein